MQSFWTKIPYPILALAPMAGVTDSAFRHLCRQYGADVVYTEMVSADGLFFDSKKTLELLKFHKKEKPVVVQLFGKDHARFTKAAQICEKHGFDGIDINFDCPAKKVAGHGGGVTLMRDLEKCKQIIEATMAGTKLPLSVKLRTSIKTTDGKKTITALDFIKYMKDLPIAIIMLHGRSYEKPFAGKPDFAMIKKAKKEFKGLLLGNGGINTPEDAKEMIEKTGCDGVGLARGLYGKPWLFEQCRDYLKDGKYKNYDFGDIKKVIIQHAKLAFKAKEDHGIIELRKHLCWYIAGFAGAKDLRKKLVRAESVEDIRVILKNS